MVPSCSIIGSSGVKAKRPMPMATASETMPVRAMRRGFVVCRFTTLIISDLRYK
jgi:hypothetical protein